MDETHTSPFLCSCSYDFHGEILAYLRLDSHQHFGPGVSLQNCLWCFNSGRVVIMTETHDIY